MTKEEFLQRAKEEAQAAPSKIQVFVKQMGAHLFYAAKWIACKASLAFPLIYLVWVFLYHHPFHLSSFLGMILLGYLVAEIFKSIRIRELDEAIDLQASFPGTKSRIKKTWLRQIVDTPLWKTMHWVLVLFFLGLTWYAMKQGLSLLFANQNLTTVIFIYVFTLVVTFTLLWLVIMITKGKKVLWFVLFYVLFDAMSAFSFNFVHFYDNIATTQKIDRTINAGQYYIDLQGYKIAELASKIESEVSKSHKNNEAHESLIKQKIDNYEELKKREKEELGTYPTEINDPEGKFSAQRKNCLNNIKNYDKQINNLLKEGGTVTDSKTSNFQSYKSQSDSLCTLRDSLSLLVIKKTPLKADAEKVKQLVTTMQSMISQLASEPELADLKISVTNDTILYINEILRDEKKDRFESIQKLFSIVKYELMSNEQKLEADAKEFESFKGHPALIKMLEENRSFEIRLLLLSIALSILIDILPLALGMFVSYSKLDEDA